MIDVTLLGCGGNMPMPNRFLSSLFVNYKGRKILIDCGEGTQVSMRINNCGFKAVDLICITHLHGDHIIGLIGLLSTIGNSGKTDPLTIIGPKGITNALNAIKVLIEYLPYNLNIIENPIGTFSFINSNLRDIEISTLSLDHSSECLAYKLYFKRQPKFSVDKANNNNVPKCLWQKLQSGNNIYFEGVEYHPDMVLDKDRKGINLSFVTDTRPLDSIPIFIKDSDLFICEGMYGSDDDLYKAIKNKHMTFKEAATLACLGNVKKLILTHFSPSLDYPINYINNASSIFNNTTVGYDGLKLSLNFDNLNQKASV